MPRNPKEYNDLIRVLNRLKALAEKLDIDLSDDGLSDDGIGDDLARAQWGRQIKTKKIPTSKLNRCGDIFSGPLFVSEKHPWPETKAGPMLPVLQLNLGKWSCIMKMDFGMGMLQVWACQGDIRKQIVRVLPVGDVKKKYLVSKIPDSILKIDDTHSQSIPLEWRGDDGESWAIIGYEKRHFAVPIWSTDHYGCITRARWLDEHEWKRIEALRKKFRQLLKQVAKKYYVLGDCIGGSFSYIQYGPSDRPPVLFNIETSFAPYFWGDMGNAQVFYDKQPDGTFKYSFEWSCT